MPYPIHLVPPSRFPLSHGFSRGHIPVSSLSRSLSWPLATQHKTTGGCGSRRSTQDGATTDAGGRGSISVWSWRHLHAGATGCGLRRNSAGGHNTGAGDGRHDAGGERATAGDTGEEGAVHERDSSRVTGCPLPVDISRARHGQHILPAGRLTGGEGRSHGNAVGRVKTVSYPTRCHPYLQQRQATSPPRSSTPVRLLFLLSLAHVLPHMRQMRAVAGGDSPLVALLGYTLRFEQWVSS